MTAHPKNKTTLSPEGVSVPNHSAPSTQTKRRRHSVLRLAVVLLATFATLACAELALIVFGIDPPRREVGAVPHARWHHWHPSNYRFEFHVSSEGFSKTVRFNNHGMRSSKNVAMAKPPGVFRIAVIGDSFVEAMQVEEHEGVVSQLQHQLTKIRGKSVQVLNFGCSGFCSSLEYVLLRDFVMRFSPDIVVCLHHFSDMTEDWINKKCAINLDKDVCCFPATDRERRTSLGHSLSSLRLYRLVSNSWNRHRRHQPPPADASLEESFDAIVHDPYTADDEKAWQYSLSFVGKMANTAKPAGIRFLVAVIPIGSQIEPVASAFAKEVGWRYLAGGKQLAHTGYQARLAGFCADQKIECIDLLPFFRAGNPSGKRKFYLPKDRHWTAAGHELAATVIADQFGKQH